MIDLTGKKILVTGATGFIGRAASVRLSQLGAAVIITGRNQPKLDDTLSRLHGSGHHAAPFDIGNQGDVKGFLRSLVDTDGRKLDGFVYCAGIFPLRPLKSVSYDYLHEMMAINFYGFVEMVKCFADRRVCRGGSIVALSSYASANGDKGQLAYAASKGALDSSIVVMSKELKAKGIRVNSIRPAALLPETMSIDEQPRGVVNIIKGMKTGPITPECLSDHIAFLISDNARKVSGQHFDVRGYLA